MILGPVSYLDCLAFCAFLAPQLIWHVGLFRTVYCVLRCLPFLVLELPCGFIRDRFWRATKNRPPFVRQAAPFEDLVIRCVRYAFANVDPAIGRVFFSKNVALPFFKFRMLRHGHIVSPVYWREYHDPNFKGIWIINNPMKPPDVVIYYCHGIAPCYDTRRILDGLFILLSRISNCLAIATLLIWYFALDYTLVPDVVFPRQLEEAVFAYEHVLSFARDPSKVVVSGDSAGAAIALSLLLHLARPKLDPRMSKSVPSHLAKPGMAVFISPWVTLQSDRYESNQSDYLDATTLKEYGRRYSGMSRDQLNAAMHSSPDYLMSPGDCRESTLWKKATPSNGIFITYGKEEVFAPEIEAWVRFLSKANVDVQSHEERGGIHAWPVASLFLCNSTDTRLKGLRTIVRLVHERIPPSQH